jgi:hypothetical protein
VIVKIPLVPTTSHFGITYEDAEAEVLEVLEEMKCWPTECYPYEFERIAEEDLTGFRSFYAFYQGGIAEFPHIKLFIPDGQPSALLAKLRWGGS